MATNQLASGKLPRLEFRRTLRAKPYFTEVFAILKAYQGMGLARLEK
jgi:hypothetical protein